MEAIGIRSNKRTFLAVFFVQVFREKTIVHLNFEGPIQDLKGSEMIE